MARLLSVNVGLPQDVPWEGKSVHTGIWKAPVTGPRMVRRLNIDGDGQGDLAGHGGEHRAVLVYQIDSYSFWQNKFGRNDFTYGQFGENFTVDGLPDQEVCIGDRYRIGSAVFEVTQPRVTCYRVGIRLNEPQMAALLVAYGRPGFYFRVLQEGHVEAGDEIVQVGMSSDSMTVSEIDALLYKPGHPRCQLERALRIPALSPGWRRSFEALLAQPHDGGSMTGNAGLAPNSDEPPAWTGFRPLRVSDKIRESADVTSLKLKPVDELPLAAALPGQFIVLRLGPESAPALIRSYSLSGPSDSGSYRVSVKRDAHGAASSYVADKVQVGDIVGASAARGSFTLQPGDTPVVLLSAGIGVTPVLAMLHALAAEVSTREIWWLYGTRNGREHPFAGETRTLLKALPNHRAYVCYSSPDPDDRPGAEFDEAGRLDISALKKLNLPSDGEFYVCGPANFMSDLTAGLAELGATPDHIHTEMFGAGASITPGIASAPRRLPHLPAGAPSSGPMVSFTRSGLTVHWEASFHTLLDLAEACDVPVRWSCRAGVCHTCETGLITGTVRYQPTPIDAPAEGNVLICCAQPDGDIVIDL